MLFIQLPLRLRPGDSIYYSIKLKKANCLSFSFVIETDGSYLYLYLLPPTYNCDLLTFQYSDFRILGKIKSCKTLLTQTNFQIWENKIYRTYELVLLLLYFCQSCQLHDLENNIFDPFSDINKYVAKCVYYAKLQRKFCIYTMKAITSFASFV